ncbi:hypothetical protein PsYK624_035520 [Phanerochaete sordida]|uniref:F-box domain-containing protein n=1 Tax=Phanerochaete sordida TaxID=48140 RepID=A0A9P3G4L0_9APHY|nr:hypothetical protein PsYK624_035520 [Phanerochaete sordida]
MLASQRCATLEKLHCELADLKRRRESLSTDADELEAQICAKVEAIAALAPVYKLPDDLVIEILNTAYLHAFPHCCRDDGLENTNSPLAVSQVSRWWRRHALALPKLWRCVHLTPKQSAGQGELTRLYVARSVGQPLSVFLVAYEEDAVADLTSALVNEFGGATWRRLRPAWQHLLTQSARWQHCAVYTNGRRQLEAVLQSLNGQAFPQLEYFGLSGPPNEPQLFQDANAMLHAPRLAALHVTHALLPDLAFPLNHVTDLTLENVPLYAGEFLHALAAASQTLRTLILNFIRFQAAPHGMPVALPEVHLPALQILVAEFVRDADGGSGVLRALCAGAPALHTLRFALGHDFLGALAAGGGVLPCVRRVQCNGLLAAGAGVPAGATLFAALPALATFQAALLDWAGTLDAARAADEEAGAGCCVAWPGLRTLVFHSLDEAPGLLRFVEHRVRVDHPLEKLVLDDANLARLSPEDRHQYEQHGLEIIGHAQAEPAIRFGLRSLQTWWDCETDRPNFELWNSEWEFWHQF